MEACKALGVSLAVSGNGRNIRIHYPDNFLPGSQWPPLLEQLKAQKQDILAELERAELEAVQVDIAERAAIFEYDGGLSRQQAERRALQEYEQVTTWREHLAVLPAPCTKEGARLLEMATAFLDSPFCLQALSLGWDVLELFGIWNGPPDIVRRRYDAMGLVPCMVWTRHRDHLSSLNDSGAEFARQSGRGRAGKPPKWPRHLTGRKYAVPFWENDYLVGGAL